MKTLATTTQIDTKTILDRPYARRLVPDPAGGYTATIQEFPGCIAEGETSEEALKNLDSVADSWLQVSLLNGREIPDPVDFDGYSGKVALRIPRSLHRQVAELAHLEGISINQLISSAIAAYVGGKGVLREVNRELAHIFPMIDPWYQLSALRMFSTVESFVDMPRLGEPLYMKGSITSVKSSNPQLLKLETNHG